MSVAARLSKINRSHQALAQIVSDRANGNPLGGARRSWMYQTWLAKGEGVAEPRRQKGADVLGVQTPVPNSRQSSGSRRWGDSSRVSRYNFTIDRVCCRQHGGARPWNGYGPRRVA